VERLREQSGGAFDLPEGTIYPALYRLEADGLLASRWSEHDGRRRRTYHVTARGRTAFARRVRLVALHSLGGARRGAGMTNDSRLDEFRERVRRAVSA